MEAYSRKRKKIILGKGFGDYLSRPQHVFIPRTAGVDEVPVIRIVFVMVVFVSVFLLLSGRLMYLTIVRGAYYNDLSSNNRVREVIIPAPRGVIYSRNDEILGRNRPIYRICDGVGGRCSVIQREDALAKEADNEAIEVGIGREYPEGAIPSHMVGYMGEINSEALTKNNQKLPITSAGYCGRCYRLGDWIGISGAEAAFEPILRGSAGRRLIEVNAQHTVQQELAKIEPVAGSNVHLSIDLGLQKVAAHLFATGAKGAIVASNPQNGEILALYSSPSFDPADVVNQLFNNADQPLFNRAISGLYPPGSTFKIITAAAGLEEGKINEDTLIEDTGIITIGAFSFANWYYTQYGKTEGEVGVVKAIARSNDIFFYKVGEWTGEAKVEDWAAKFGLGALLGIEIAGEEKGSIRRDRQWYLGDTYHLAIGQGDLLATPLQINTMTATIANGGVRCRPTILKSEIQSNKFQIAAKAGSRKGGTNSKSKIQNSNEDCEDIGLSKKTVELITEGMKGACEPGGTAYPLFKFHIDGDNGMVQIPVACKTGTAEFGDPENHTHAWLTAFAPVEKPEVVVTVLVEGGGEGSTTAGPMVKALLEEYFQQ